MMIHVTCSLGDTCLVNFRIGRKGKNASYVLNHRGHLVMPKNEWELFRKTLERGAVRPVVVVIDEVADEEPAPSNPQPVTNAEAKEASPF